MKVGDLVRYRCHDRRRFDADDYRLGYITDVMEDTSSGVESGWNMYEVVCTDPYDRAWFSDIVLEVVSESR